MNSPLNTARAASQALRALADPQKAAILSGFFKTGPGQYGEGDIFIGVTVPRVRSLAKTIGVLPLTETRRLLESKIHEERLLALVLLIHAFDKANVKEQTEVVRFYLSNTRHLNNWDLIDISAPRILGAWLLGRPEGEAEKILGRLAGSPVMWERRIAIVSTHAFIRKGQFEHTLTIAEKYLLDKEDLIRKATGWMLREVGKRDRKVLANFLKKRCAVMPRTMLRYALEHFSAADRASFMEPGKKKRDASL